MASNANGTMEEDDGSNIAESDDQVHSDDFRGYLNCPSCREIMKAPVSLPCLDSFCMDCLRRKYEAQKQRLQDHRARLQQEEGQRQREEDIETEEEEETSDQDTAGSVHSSDGSSVRETVLPAAVIDGLQADHYSIPSSVVVFGQRVVSDRFCCPLEDCDGVTTLSLDNDNELDNLEINYPLQNLERTISLKQDLPLGRVKCDFCSNTAIGVCYSKDCNNRPFCGDCINFHLRDKKKHVIAYPDSQEEEEEEEEEGEGAELRGGADHCAPPPQTLPHSDGASLEEKQPASNKVWKNLKQGDIFCHIPDHEEYRRCFYCSDHDEVICLACTAANEHHRRCENVGSVNLVYEQKIEETNHKLEEVKRLHLQFEAALVTTKKMKESLDLKVEEIKKSITGRFNVLKQQLECQRDDLLNKCDILRNDKADELDQHLGMLNRVNGTFDRCIRTVTGFKHELIPSEFMILKTQFDRRLDELVTTYSNYHRNSREDDCIFFEENTSFSLSNAIGRVYSTPSVKNFTLHALTNVPIANQPSHFTIVTHDAIRNKIVSYSYMPKLCATIKHIEDSEVMQGYVSKDKRTGRYYVTVIPSRSGRHELSIFQPLKPPYDKCYVGEHKYIVMVVEDRFFPFPVLIPP